MRVSQEELSLNEVERAECGLESQRSRERFYLDYRG